MEKEPQLLSIVSSFTLATQQIAITEMAMLFNDLPQLLYLKQFLSNVE